MIAAFLRLLRRKPRASRQAPAVLGIQRLIAQIEGELPDMPEGAEKEAAQAKLAALYDRLEKETDALRTWA